MELQTEEAKQLLKGEREAGLGQLQLLIFSAPSHSLSVPTDPSVALP